MQPDDFQTKFLNIKSQIGSVVLGQEDVIEHCLVALISRGHLLIEGVPGLGKTLLVRALAKALGASFGRIQFTPDLMPSDVTGGSIYNQKSGAFEFIPGPVFAELLLADEINRAPAKTQSALLEAMQERTVTIDGKSRPLPEPFLVMATQNPVEAQGTYPLPEAQLDRFLLKVNVDYPDQPTECALLSAYVEGFDPEHLSLTPVIGKAELLEMQALTRGIDVDPSIIDYITRLVRSTREHRSVDVGASPRASVGLLQTARTQAASEGRAFVIPDDVKRFAPAVLRHRILLHPDAQLEGITEDQVIASIVTETPVPGGTS